MITNTHTHTFIHTNMQKNVVYQWDMFAKKGKQLFLFAV